MWCGGDDGSGVEGEGGAGFYKRRVAGWRSTDFHPHVSNPPSKIPYVGFSPIRLQMQAHMAQVSPSLTWVTLKLYSSIHATPERFTLPLS